MSAIRTPDVLARFVSTTLTFEDLARFAGEELGSASDPYAVIGLTISKAIVNADAGLNSSSRGVALKSTRLPAETSLDEIDLRFTRPQRGFGFYYRTSHAASLMVTAFDGNKTVLEENVFGAGEGYAGIIRARADIRIVTILARIESADSAENSCFYIDDLTFGTELKAGY